MFASVARQGYGAAGWGPALLVAMLALAGCSGPESVADLATGKDIVMASASGNAQASGAVDPAVTAGLAKLGWQVLRESPASKGSTANSINSPWSVGNALGLLHAGARGETASQIGELLATTKQTKLPQAMQHLNAALQTPVAGVDIVSANRLWVDAGLTHPLNADYVATARDAYRADGVSVRFSEAASAAGTINQWVASASKGRIPNLLSASSLPTTTQLVVTNAVYFKGQWRQEFSPGATRAMPFTGDDGRRRDVPTMNALISLAMIQANGMDVAMLPYGNGDFAMLLAVPSQGDQSLDAALKGLNGEVLGQWLTDLARARSTPVALSLPKFRIDPSPVSLKPALMAAGMRAPFSSQADFSGIAGKLPLMLDDVIHAAGIIVDEQGSEATAATAAVVRTKSLPPTPVPLRFDRPFYFAVVHVASGVPLFMGTLRQPVFQ